jgi:hypothetical protein
LSGRRGKVHKQETVTALSIEKTDMVSYLDRVNIGFAKLQMLGDLHLSDNVYALGASMLFWGYVLFEMPSNIALHRVGTRWWLA